MGTFIMPKHSSDAFEFKMALKVCYDHREENDGWLSGGHAQNGVDGFSLYLYNEYHAANWKEHSVPKIDNSDYTKDAQLPAYFGFIDIRGNRNAQERKITEQGIKFLNAMNEEDSDTMHELILQSIEHQTFGRNNAACGNSDSDCEAPGILVIASIVLNGIKRKEFYYLLSTLDNSNIDFAHALARVMSCRKDGTPVPEVDTVYTDAKFIPFLKEIGFLTENSELLSIEPTVYAKYSNRLLNVKTFNNEEDNGLYDSCDETEKTAHQIIFYGAPGTGKSFRIKEKLKALNVPKDNIIRTTFHPDSDYSTFVGAYKPTRGLKPLYGLNGTNTVRLNDGKDLSEEIITYKFVAQAFLKAYIKAYEKPEENVYLVIEEINRGNCAQIFGDLFQLLDRDADGNSEYSIKADDDLRDHLEEKLDADNAGIAGGELCLPSNLYIYATMNTSDQSLFPIDSAFKRRWDWEYEPIKYNHDLRISIAGVNYKWTSFQEKVNALIKLATNSEDKMLGDYFVNPANGVIDENTLRNKVLFYLWNDVCKDGEGDIFKVSDNKDLTFSELYGNEGTSNLIKMMQCLGIEEYEDETDSEEDDDDANEENGRNEGNTTQKDFSSYKINGQGEYRKRTLPFETIKKYVGQHPEKNATDILNELRSIKAENPVLPYNFIADETEYSNLSSDAKGRVKALNVNGENIYISNQWKFDNIKKFIEVVNNSNWGILIESVSTNN